MAVIKYRKYNIARIFLPQRHGDTGGFMDDYNNALCFKENFVQQLKVIVKKIDVLINFVITALKNGIDEHFSEYPCLRGLRMQVCMKSDLII